MELKVKSVAKTIAGLLAAAVLLTGCQTASPHGLAEQESVKLPPLTEIKPLTNPRTYEGPTTAIIGGPSIPALTDTPAPQLPVTVSSKDRGGDKKITVRDTSRIVPLSLSGSVGELVYAFGQADKIVGRDISTNFSGAEKIPVVTHEGHSIDAEAVVALNPSLIITDGSIGPTDVVLQLRDAGIPVVTVERAVDPESSYRAAVQVAQALGLGQLAKPFVQKLKKAISAKEKEISRLVPKDKEKLPRVAFLYVRGGSGVFYLFGEGSGVDSTIRSLGAVDVAAQAQLVGERPMTEEALVKMNPDILLVMSGGLKSVGGVDGLLTAQPSIALTNAGKHRRIVDVDDRVLFAGGLRIPDVLDGLARAIYAPDSLSEYQK